MENILEAEIRSFHYGEDLILKDLKMSVKKGEIVVLTGLSGCGKTTLLRLLNGLIPSFYDGDLNGEIKILGKDITAYKKGELAKYIGNVFQNPKDQFFCDVVEDEIALVGENLGLDRDTLKEKVEKAMDLLGISHISKKSIFELSGGEAQRVKLATELSKRATGKTLYILDEPTTGLHIADVHRLVDILQRLVDTGNTIIVIEHNLDLIKTADHIIDLGPEGGDAGGEVIAVGTPKQICKNEKSYTGKFMKRFVS